jgi:hypothetical protein
MPPVRFPGSVLLLLAFGLMVSSAVQKSPTVDEQSHLFRGIAYVKTGATHFLWGHPLLASAVNALPLLTVSDLRLPQDEPAWATGDWAVAGDAFLWRLNPNPQRLVFLGRLSTIWLTLLLGALGCRWGYQLKGAAAGLMALALLTLDPNVLAHGQLITSDLPLTLFAVVAVYGYWRWASITEGAPKNSRNSANSQQPSAVNSQLSLLTPLLLGGTGLGAAAATKFSAALLLPALALLALLLALRWRSLRPLAATLLMGLIAWLTVWVIYRFAWSPLPGGAFWDDLAWQFDYLSRPHGAYLLGRSDPWGWWYYFPAAFLVKTPLPTLILLAWAVVQSLSGLTRPGNSWEPAGTRHSRLFLLFPSLTYLVISLFSPLNIGYRHLIPLLPFLSLFIATTLVRRHAPGTKSLAPQVRYLAPYALAVLVILSALFSWPDYIPYFNRLAGRPAESWRILSDSNIDWGQDLPALARWQQRTAEPLKLSYFGLAHPSAYGLQFVALPTWAPGPEQTDPAYQPFNPVDPAPGLYAISVTNLHGLVLGAEHNTFAWFRGRTPIARIGGSIFVYRVEPRGVPAQVAFAGLRPADLEPALHALFQTNDVNVRWFDARTSLIWPAGNGWLAVSGQAPDPALQTYWPPEKAAQAGDQRLYRLSEPPAFDWDGHPAELGGSVTFLGYRFLEMVPGEISLLTAWRVSETSDRPLKIFVHALDEDGMIAGQWDGLDVRATSWQPGDIFIQWHRFPVPPTAEPLHLVVGMYDGATLERLAEPLPLEQPANQGS